MQSMADEPWWRVSSDDWYVRFNSSRGRNGGNDSRFPQHNKRLVSDTETRVVGSMEGASPTKYAGHGTAARTHMSRPKRTQSLVSEVDVGRNPGCKPFADSQ